MKFNIPISIVLGDSATWTDTLSGYEPSAGFSLAYAFNGATAWQLNGVPNLVNGFDFAISTAQSSALSVGVYWWQLVATKPNVRETLGSGRLEVTINLSVAVTPIDNRTEAEKMLAKAVLAYDSALIGSARYKIGDREKESHEIRTLRTEMIYWKNRVYLEKVARGEIEDSRYAKVRFTAL